MGGAPAPCIAMTELEARVSIPISRKGKDVQMASLEVEQSTSQAEKYCAL